MLPKLLTYKYTMQYTSIILYTYTCIGSNLFKFHCDVSDVIGVKAFVVALLFYMAGICRKYSIISTSSNLVCCIVYLFT